MLADITGRDRDGELIAVPTEWDEEQHGAPPKIRIHAPRRAKPGEAGGVGDRALLRVEETGEADDAIRHSGRVIKIIDRAKQRVLGIFRALPGGGGRLVPVDKKQLGRELAIPPGADGRRRRTATWSRSRWRRGKSGFGLATARVAEKLGSLKSERAVSLIAIHAHGIPNVFPAAVIDEAEAARAGQARRPRGLARLPLVTIDPADAKDHDDAVHATADPDPGNRGGFILNVAIADVAHYVRPGSALDREALIRGNSVYFPDRVVPMLPERISNDLCSLRPNEDRAALAVRMVIGADGRKRSHTFHRVLMRSAAKLSYQQAQAAIDGWPDDTTGPLLGPVLEPLYAAYRALKRAREERAPLDLDLPERKIVLTAHSTVDRVVTPERLDAHRLIEEFMILANVAAAETLERAHVPLIYRVHDEPDMERVNALREFLQTLDISLPEGRRAAAAAVQPASWRASKAATARSLVNEVVLRTQAQAEYAAENYGHFGLNLRRYAHFTSPIRRYADLVVHRGLIRAQKLGDDGLPDRHDVERSARSSATISATERRAMKAERETFDRLLAHFLADRIGATFEGHISGVTRAGLFVKLDDTGADGFIPARTVGAEYFRYHEDRHALIGDRSGETYRLGDRVTVKLVEAAPVAGALRFELLSEGRYDSAGTPRPQRAEHKHPASRPARRPERAQETAPMSDRHADHLDRMNEFVAKMNAVRARPLVPQRPAEDAATLILIDRSGEAPKVLLGKRHASHKFMPGKFVFPGGRVDPVDRRMPVAQPLDPHMEAATDAARAAPERGEGARVRARRDPRDLRGDRPAARGAGRSPGQGSRRAVDGLCARRKFLPDLGALHFVGRAITPPGRIRRFDARFFTADASAIAHRVEGITGPDAELVELVWMPLAEAQQLDMPAVTGVMLEELERAHRRRLRPRPAGAVLSASAWQIRARNAVSAPQMPRTRRPFLDIAGAAARFRPKFARYRGLPWRRPPPSRSSSCRAPTPASIT